MTISKLIKKLSMTVAGTAFVAFSGTTIAQAITITPTSSGNTLVENILGTGITVDLGSINYTGANGASGIFTDGLSIGPDGLPNGIGLDQGIILTTGTAKDAEGPNVSDKTTTKNNLPGDSDLNGLIPGAATQDATILEFDFKTEGGNLFFNYVFASEEYVEWTNSTYNDVFGFFLNGKNIALIPKTETETPVAINTVNGGNPIGTNASHEHLFNNNDLDDRERYFDIEYDGFTNVFTAQALNLAAGTHRIKLAIADTGDQAWDSAVFIQARSFSDVKTPYGETPDVSKPSTEEPSRPIIVGDVSSKPPAQNTPDPPESSEETPKPPLFAGILAQPPTQNTPDVSQLPLVGDILSEPPTQNTPDFPEPSEETPDFSQPSIPKDVLGETTTQNPEDVPEPSVVIGLLAVGFAGSLLKKKSTESDK